MTRLSILAAARQEPGRIGLIDERGSLTFPELAALACAATEPSEHRVLVAPRRTREDVALLLGMLEHRVAFALAHPRWTRAELDAAVTATGARVVWADGQPRTTDLRARGQEQVLVFTSGTSGRPKIVRLSRRALDAAARAHGEALPWRDEDRWLLALPLAHVGGFSILTRCLYARRTIVLMPDAPFDADRLIETAEAHRVTLLSVVPTMLEPLVHRSPPSSLRAILVGGAGARTSLIAAAREAGWPVLPTFGMSETAAQVCTQRLGDERTSGTGPPLPGVEVRIGQSGQIEVRGPTLMDGYLGEPARVEGTFFSTGDLGRLDADGHLHVEGRVDHRILSGGENVDPLEVEAALLEHPAIAQACVLGEPDDTWGQVVVAFVAPAPGPSQGDLERHLATRLAPFKRPRHVFARPELPLLRSGKVNREALRGAGDAP